MDQQPEKSRRESRKTSRLAIVSLAFGAFAFWPYLAFPTSIFINLINFHANQASPSPINFFNMIVIFSALFLGVPAGLVGLVAGIHTLLRIRQLGKVVNAPWMAILGMIAGLLSIAANFTFWWLVLKAASD